MFPFLPSLIRWQLPVLLLALPFAAQAQSGGVRIGTTGTPAPSAVLDLSPDAAAAPKGFLPPRLSTAQRNAIGAPATGLTVFNTTTNALNVWDGTRWVAYLSDTTPAAATTVSFAYTGGPQAYTVPAGVTSLKVDLAGAAGGPRFSLSTGQGLGGRVQAILAVTPGQVLTLYVGGAGARNMGGYNGGGGASAGDGGGGGASDLRQGGTALANRVLVAGGGGGGGDDGGGGCGGGLTACAGSDDGSGGAGGGGGTPIAPGAGGPGGTG